MVYVCSKFNRGSACETKWGGTFGKLGMLLDTDAGTQGMTWNEGAKERRKEAEVTVS